MLGASVLCSVADLDHVLHSCFHYYTQTSFVIIQLNPICSTCSAGLTHSPSNTLRFSPLMLNTRDCLLYYLIYIALGKYSCSSTFPRNMNLSLLKSRLDLRSFQVLKLPYLTRIFDLCSALDMATPFEFEGQNRVTYPFDLHDLKDGSIHILIFLRGTDEGTRKGPSPFHWGLYHHWDFPGGGRKYHIKGGTGHWITDHGTARDTLISFALVGLVHLGNISASNEEVVREIICRDDNKMNHDPSITCRIWIRNCCERLRAAGCVEFSTWADLEAEVFQFGDSFFNSAVLTSKPRPMLASKACNMSS